MSNVQLNKQQSGDIEVSGQLGFSEVSGVLKSSLTFFNGQEDLLFDLGAVEKTDSAGLALLVEWVSMANKSAQNISFQRVPKQILDIARVSGLDEILPLVNSSLKFKK